MKIVPYLRSVIHNYQLTHPQHTPGYKQNKAIIFKNVPRKPREYFRTLYFP